MPAPRLALAYGLVAFSILAACSSNGSASGPEERNIIQNGGFELPKVDSTGGNTVSSYLSSSQAITGWTTSNVDIVTHGLWSPAEGTQSLDLNGSSAGWIQQVVATQPNQFYLLAFAYSANTDLSAYPQNKRFRVMWSGSPVETLTVAATNPIRWSRDTLLLMGTGRDSLRFESLVTGNAGPALDDISLIGP